MIGWLFFLSLQRKTEERSDGTVPFQAKIDKERYL
jgi:hypothetical protein